MKFRKAFKHALFMVIHAKLRSWLTILGIVIGVAAVIAIMSLGDSLQSDINDQLGDLGADLITLSVGSSRASGFGPPGMGGGQSSSATKEDEESVLDKQDLQVLKGIQDIASLSAQISGSVDIYYVAEKGSASVTGVDTLSWSEFSSTDIAEGRDLGASDSNVVVIGGKIANGFFSKEVGVNQLLTIEDKLFRIVGVLDDSSTTIYMPINSAYEILEDSRKNEYDKIIIKVKDEDSINETMETIESKLRNSRHVTKDEQDFSLSSNQQSQSQRTEMMESMKTFLTAIAAVALLVGAVGVANTMFTSVLEKTKEIGIMKAIGARNNDILKIFILHAALIGLIGGVIGILFGVALSGILPSLMGSSGGVLSRMSEGGTIVSWNSIIWALSISVLIGVLSGLIPAYQASKLKPVDALRYE